MTNEEEWRSIHGGCSTRILCEYTVEYSADVRLVVRSLDVNVSIKTYFRCLGDLIVDCKE